MSIWHLTPHVPRCSFLLLATAFHLTHAINNTDILSVSFWIYHVLSVHCLCFVSKLDYLILRRHSKLRYLLQMVLSVFHLVSSFNVIVTPHYHHLLPFSFCCFFPFQIQTRPVFIFGYVIELQ